MESINIAAVLVTNLMAALMLLIVLSNNLWRLKSRSVGSEILLALIALSLVSCFVDCVSSLVVGRSGLLFLVLGYASNTWLYVMNVAVGSLCVAFLATHLNVKLPAWVKKAGIVLATASIFILLVNFFVPITFYIDGAGVYHRGPVYWYFVVVELVYLFASLSVYVSARKTGGMLKTFPLWVFLVPVLLGIVLQACFYGISTVWPFVAVAISGVVTGLQSELIFRDKLTGLYNRFYLDNIASRALLEKPKLLTVLWMDVNDFKLINDTYGHAAGDSVLVAVGAALTDAVGALGAVMRYSGDEFVVLLNTQNTDEVNACIDRIMSALAHLDLSGLGTVGVTAISASIGSFPYNPQTLSMDEALNRVDLLMYEQKRAYHAKGTSHDRRVDEEEE